MYCGSAVNLAFLILPKRLGNGKTVQLWLLHDYVPAANAARARRSRTPEQARQAALRDAIALGRRIRLPLRLQFVPRLRPLCQGSADPNSMATGIIV